MEYDLYHDESKVGGYRADDEQVQEGRSRTVLGISILLAGGKVSRGLLVALGFVVAILLFIAGIELFRMR